MERRIDVMVAVLAGRGVAQGDRVLVQSINCKQMFAWFRLGAVWVPTNLRQTPSEVAYPAGASRPTALTGHGDFPDHVAAIRAPRWPTSDS